MILNPTAYRDAVLADNPAAYWRLNEPSGTAVASAVAGPPAGVIAGGVTLAQPGALGIADTAMTFDGSTGAITFANGAFVAFGTGGASIEAWVKTTSSVAKYFVDSKVGGSVNAGIGVQFLSTGRITARVANGVAISSVTTPASPVYNDGAWHHVVCVVTRGATDSLLVYVDGALKMTGALPAAGWNLTSALGFRIGTFLTDASPSVNHFDGSIDEVALYGSSLTATQIVNHFARRGVIRYLPFDLTIRQRIDIMEDWYMASPEAAIRVGDIGTEFRATVKDQNGDAVSIGSATVKQFVFRKPDDVTIVKSASFVTNGADGQMAYVAGAGDLDLAGPWQLQGYVEVSGGTWHTAVYPFVVEPNLT